MLIIFEKMMENSTTTINASFEKINGYVSHILHPEINLGSKKVESDKDGFRERKNIKSGLESLLDWSMLFWFVF